MTSHDAAPHPTPADLPPRLGVEDVQNLSLPQLLQHTERWIDARVGGGRAYEGVRELDCSVGSLAVALYRPEVKIEEVELALPTRDKDDPFSFATFSKLIPNGSGIVYELNRSFSRAKGYDLGYRHERIRWQQGDKLPIRWSDLYQNQDPYLNCAEELVDTRRLQPFARIAQEGQTFDQKRQLVVGDKIILKRSIQGLGVLGVRLFRDIGDLFGL